MKLDKKNNNAGNSSLIKDMFATTNDNIFNFIGGIGDLSKVLKKYSDEKLWLAVSVVTPLRSFYNVNFKICIVVGHNNEYIPIFLISYNKKRKRSKITLYDEFFCDKECDDTIGLKKILEDFIITEETAEDEFSNIVLWILTSKKVHELFSLVLSLSSLKDKLTQIMTYHEEGDL